MTIGYGVRYPSEECPEAIIVMVIEVFIDLVTLEHHAPKLFSTKTTNLFSKQREM